MTDKTLLAERVEALDGPTYEIFEEAFFACNPGPSVFGCSSYHNEAIKAHGAQIRRFKELVDVGAWLDAAMTLVPEGWLVVYLSDLGGAGGCVCRLGNPGTSQEAISDHGARTLAFALTAAALRAGETK